MRSEPFAHHTTYHTHHTYHTTRNLLHIRPTIPTVPPLHGSYGSYGSQSLHLLHFLHPYSTSYTSCTSYTYCPSYTYNAAPDRGAERSGAAGVEGSACACACTSLRCGMGSVQSLQSARSRRSKDSSPMCLYVTRSCERICVNADAFVWIPVDLSAGRLNILGAKGRGRPQVEKHRHRLCTPRATTSLLPLACYPQRATTSLLPACCRLAACRMGQPSAD